MPFSTVDYPGYLSCVVFMQGCPWRCSYCQNSHLLKKIPDEPLSWKTIIEFLKKRKAVLEAVVFSGGEPTFQESLMEHMALVKELGYKVGLHTNGFDPDALSKVLPPCDWIGFDVKHLFDKYDKLGVSRHYGDKVKKSLDLLEHYQKDYEVRITVHSDIHNKEDIDQILDQLKLYHPQKIVLQRCDHKHTLGCLRPNLINEFVFNEIDNEFMMGNLEFRC